MIHLNFRLRPTLKSSLLLHGLVALTLAAQPIVCLAASSKHASGNPAAKEKYELGELLIFNGNRRAAIAAFEQAVALDPNMLAPHQALAQMFSENGELNRQIQELTELVRLQPEAIETRITLAGAQKKCGLLDASIANFEECLKQTTSETDRKSIQLSIAFILLDKGNLEAANSLLKSLNSENDSSILLGRAMCEFKLGNIESANKLIDKAEIVGGSNPEAHCLRGDLLFSQGVKVDAIKQYQLAITEQPKLAQAHQSLANVLLETGDYTLCRAEYQKANELKPHDVETLYGVAISAEKCGDVHAAIENYNEALKYERDEKRKTVVRAHLSDLHSN